MPSVLNGCKGLITAAARRRPPAWGAPAALAIVFVAFALYTTTLTLQSMWIDEVMALFFTKGSFSQTMRAIVSPSHNGPLFYLLLYAWRQIAGDSDFAVRFLSVAPAVLTIPLLFQWARRLLTERTALLAAWLFAFSPFVFWFAQEAKMYALHMLFAVASSLTLLAAFRRGRWWRWLLYAALVSTVLYSHFFGAFLVASQAVMALLLGWRRGQRLLAYAAAMLSLALAHLPLLRFGLAVLQRYRPQDIWRGFVPLHEIAHDAIGHYFYRVGMPQVPWSVFLLATGLALAGSLALFLLPRRDALVIPLHAITPVLLFYAISIRVPIYGAKYLAAVVPALFVLVAWGTEALARLWRPAGVLILALGVLMTNGVVRDLTDPAVQRSDWRFVADYVDAHESDRDIVVVSAEYARHAFKRYYQGQSRVVPFTGNPYNPWPFYQPYAEQRYRMWLVLHQADAMAPGHVLDAVAGHFFPVITAQYPNAGQIALIGYQMRFAYPALPASARPLDLCFENGLCLVGYALDATSLTATEKLSHPPSNWIHAVLYWRAGPQTQDFTVRPLLRVVDEAFLVWGGNMERRPDLFDYYPPPQWAADEVVETHFDLNLNPLTPPGTYRLELSLAIEGDENRRVAVADPLPDAPADRYLFEVIQILPER